MKNYVLLLLIPKEEIIKILNFIIIKDLYQSPDRKNAISSYPKIAIQSLLILLLSFYILFNMTMQKRNMLIQ